MEELKKTAAFALETLKALGADDAQVSVVRGDVEEYNVDAGEFSLIRTVFSQSISMKVIKDHKKGTVAVNRLDEDAIRTAAAECMDAAESGAADEAVAIAEKEENADFTDGALTPDKAKFFDSLITFTEDLKKEFPEIMLEQMVASYSGGKHVFANSNGVLFTEHDGSYSVSVMYSAHREGVATSFNYFDLETTDPGARLMDLGMCRTQFRRAVEELDAVPFEGKFLGTAVFAPGCMDDVISVITGAFTGDYALIEGTSPWKEKLGQTVASPAFTLSVIPDDPRIVCGEKFTVDGYRSENYDVIKDGVLQAFCLSDYGARKTGGKRAPSTSGAVEVKAGTKPLDALLADIENGILVCRFSGGEPASNGDFSGVAKNSFLIKNGKLAGALSETMISGNFAAMLQHIRGISSDVLCDGGCVLPYVAFDGVTVSGKTDGGDGEDDGE